MDKKKEALEKLRLSEAVYMILSNCSNMPYVVCDQETYDDQILLFFTEEDAKREAMKLLEAHNPVQIVKLENRMLLNFYTGLYAMGVNCMLVNKGMEEEVSVQLNELITRPDADKIPEGQVRIENPEFHLTALYFTQEFRKDPAKAMTDELEKLNEEMMAHFRKGTYLVAMDENQKVPALKDKEGNIYQPVFTDFSEFFKFNREKKFRAIPVEGEKIGDILIDEAVGIVANPFGVNIMFKVNKR